MDMRGPSRQTALALYLSSSDASGSGGGIGDKGEGDLSFPPQWKTIKATHEYQAARLEEIQPDEIDDVIQAYSQRLVAPKDLTDRRLRLNYFYRIKLVSSLNLPEIFGRLTYTHPKDTVLEKVTLLSLLVPKLTGPPVKVTVKGDWVGDKNNFDSSRLRVPFYLSKDEEDVVKDANLLRNNGFEPVLYDQADPVQTPMNAVSWINVVSGAWLGALQDTGRRDKVLNYFKGLMESDNHIVINYRSPTKDFDINRHFNIIPVQWADHSFFDAFERGHVEKIAITFYNTILQNLAVNRLKP